MDDDNTGFDYTDYETPPFRPDHVQVGQPEEEEADTVHILPIDGGRPTTPTAEEEDEEFPAADSPHNPSSDAAKGAASADADFTEITDEPTTTSGPTSFEDDPDASSTSACEDPYNDNKPLVQYALTIDAGSTGSRIHVYKFQNCGPSPQLEYETFKMLHPGLSAFARDPKAAASLDPLLEEAKRVVPESLWKCTPVEVKATAGLRLLGAQESEAILDEVRNRLETNWDFVVGGEKSVEIMDGKDEGELAISL